MVKGPSTVVVVVPARNEERRLPACLAALDVARSRLKQRPGPIPVVRIVVVLDRCSDDSEAIAAAWPGVDTVRSGHGKVGAARAVGIRHALGRTGLSRSTWIACTDADSAVPVDWLETHLRFAAAGADLLLGTVRPDPEEITAAEGAQWLSEHDLTDGHPHIHGANLGIRAEMYERAGGFAWVAAHEDVLLTDRVRNLGGSVISTSLSPVLTSARTTGRAPAGMATYLHQMALDLAGSP